MSKRSLRLLRVAVAALFIGSVVAACAPAPAPTPTPAPKPAAATPTTAPAKPAPSPTSAPAKLAAPSPTVAAKPAATPAAKPAASPAAAGAPGTIAIVSSLPRTGSSKGQIDTIVNAIKMAIDERGGKVGTFTIDFRDWDDAVAATGKWDAGKEADNANKAVNDPDVMVYLGTFNSGAAKVSIPILNRANLVMVSPANVYPGLSKKIEGVVEKDEPDKYYPSGKRNYTRVVPSDELQGAVGASWAKKLGAKTVYVLDDTELYGHGLALVFSQSAKKIGLTVAGEKSIDPKATDYRALALEIKSKNPEVVYYGGITHNNAGKLWKDLRAVLGPRVKLMGPDGIFEDAFLKDAGDAAEGTYVTFGGVPPDKLTGKGATWYKNYKDKFKAEPEAYAAYGYEAASVALAAIERAAKKDRAAILTEVFNTKSFAGVLGTWSFTETGDTTLTDMSGQIVQGGKFTFEGTLKAE